MSLDAARMSAYATLKQGVLLDYKSAKPLRADFEVPRGLRQG
jgi:hypothetical protein